MPKDKLDEIRSKLGIESLGETDKKDLFSKFVNAGGQVVDLNPKKQQPERKIKTTEAKAEEQMHREEAASVKKAASVRHNIDLDPENQKNNPINKWIERFSAHLACVFSGVLSLPGDFTNSFRSFILTDYQDALLNCRMVLASVLYQDRFIAGEIKKRFLGDPVFPYYFELLFRFDNLYSEELFVNLQGIRNSGSAAQDMQGLLIQVFKPIFMLQPYYFSLKTGLERTLVMEKEIRKLDSSQMSSNLRKVISAADFIFAKLYPRLYSLIDYYYKKDTKERPMPFRTYLHIDEADGIGFYTNLWKEELAAAAKKEEDGQKKNQNVQKSTAAPGNQNPDEDASHDLANKDEQDPAKKGLRIIEKYVNFRKALDNYIEKKDPRGLFSIKDKVFLTYTLVDFFDKEFSFIFNSNKVEFNIVFMDGKRMDMKRELADVYYKVSGIFERVTEYLKIIREVRKLDSDTFISIQERSGRSNQYSLQRSQVSRQMRKDTRDFFEEFSKRFLTIVSDLQKSKKVLANAEAVLEFDRKISGERYANGRKVQDIIEDAYCFANILVFLLVDGDLGGFSLMAEKPIYLQLGE